MEKNNFIPFQLCPKCNGQKKVATNPTFVGDLTFSAITNGVTYTCGVCEGKGIIPMYSVSEKKEPIPVLLQVSDKQLEQKDRICNNCKFFVLSPMDITVGRCSNPDSTEDTIDANYTCDAFCQGNSK